MSGRFTPHLVVAALYVSQGTIYGFAGFILLPQMAARGVSLEAQTGILALAGLPWVLKLAWAPLVDRLGYAARDFATAAMVGLAVVLAALASVDDVTQSVATVGVLWLLLNVLLSLQDVAADALALDVIPPQERGLANGFMLGGHHVGSEGIAGLGLGAVVAAQGVGWALAVQAVVVLALAIVPRLAPRTALSPRRASWSALRELVRDRRTLALAGVAATVMLADVVTSSVASEFIVNRLKWSPDDIARFFPPVLLGASVLGYVAAAVAVDRVGHARAAAVGSALLGLLWLSFAASESMWLNRDFMLGFIAAQAVATALMFVGVHALLMDAVTPAVRATQFAVFMALLNLPRAIAPTAAPPLVGALDFAGLFAVCGVYQLAMGALLIRFR